MNYTNEISNLLPNPTIERILNCRIGFIRQRKAKKYWEEICQIIEEDQRSELK